MFNKELKRVVNTQGFTISKLVIDTENSFDMVEDDVDDIREELIRVGDEMEDRSDNTHERFAVLSVSLAKQNKALVESHEASKKLLNASNKALKVRLRSLEDHLGVSFIPGDPDDEWPCDYHITDNDFSKLGQLEELLDKKKK